MQLEKEKQTKLKVNGRKEIIKIRAEISETEIKITAPLRAVNRYPA